MRKHNLCWGETDSWCFVMLKVALGEIWRVCLRWERASIHMCHCWLERMWVCDWNLFVVFVLVSSAIEFTSGRAYVNFTSMLTLQVVCLFFSSLSFVTFSDRWSAGGVRNLLLFSLSVWSYVLLHCLLLSFLENQFSKAVSVLKVWRQSCHINYCDKTGRVLRWGISSNENNQTHMCGIKPCSLLCLHLCRSFSLQLQCVFLTETCSKQSIGSYLRNSLIGIDWWVF